LTSWGKYDTPHQTNEKYDMENMGKSENKDPTSADHFIRKSLNLLES
jgi:hypothetical protein